MSTETSRSLDSDCGPSDPNWRDSTYLDSLAGLPERDYERKLGEVLLWRKFAPQQPPEFREFGGCRARLHIRVLDIDEVRQKTLLVAIAGSGARVPGTKFVLRVAYPGWAYFEEQSGDFPALPHDWMKALHLIKDGWEERYEWIGHRHDEVQYVVRWDRYEETANGWRLKPRGAMQLTQAQWRAEIERVSAQLTEFIDELLPAIARHDPGVFDIPTEPSARYFAQRLRRLDDWLEAAGRLRDVVDSRQTATPQRLELEFCRQFTYSEPSIEYAVDNGRIHWAISCFSEVDWLSAAYNMFRSRYGWPPKDERHPGYSIDATKRFLLTGSTDSTGYYNEYIAMLAALADSEPEFVKEMLNAEAWRQRIESNSALSDEERERQIQKLTAPIPRRFFRMVIHNAMLHVIGALANNQFEEVGECIEHPEFVGRYSPLVPHYLFANLLAKAHVIEKYRVSTAFESRPECA